MLQRLLKTNHTDKTVIISALIVFGILLSFIITLYPTSGANITITQFLQNRQLTFLTPFMVATSILGDVPYVFYVAALFMGIFMLLKMPLAASFIVVTFINHPINYFIKVFIHRARPTDDSMIVVFKELSGYSFPSGHVTHYVVFYGFILFVLLHARSVSKSIRGIGMLLCALLIILVGPSRIFLGAHWFTDVLGGYILGSLILLLLIPVYHKLIPVSTRVQGTGRKSIGR